MLHHYNQTRMTTRLSHLAQHVLHEFMMREFDIAYVASMSAAKSSTWSNYLTCEIKQSNYGLDFT